jgi:hypothetical protein
MGLLTKITYFLWRPFEIHSARQPEKIEKDLSSQIIKEPFFHLTPYYDRLYGSVEDGKFTIKYAPESSVFMRGAGRVRVQGRIDKDKKGSRISGYLPGPPFAIWFFMAMSFVLPLFNAFSMFTRHEPVQWTFLFVYPLIVLVFSVGIFVFDRNMNQEGERRILDALREVAD